MSDLPRGPSPETVPAEPAAGGNRDNGARSPPGAPAHPPSVGGRAHAFRIKQAERRTARWEQVGVLLIVVLIVVAFATILTAKPFTPSSGPGYPAWWPNPPGTPILVQLGTPSVGTVTCGQGGTAYTERVSFLSSSQPITTGNAYLVVYEIGDGDYIGDANTVANATATNVCSGSPPGLPTLWYAVLVAPNGTNLLTYTEASDWTAVTGSSWNIPMEAGSTLVLVTGASLAGTGRALGVIGFVGQSTIRGTVPL